MTYRIGLRHVAKIGRRAVEWYQAASAYFELVGSVWFPEPWGYFERGQGTGFVTVGDGGLGEPVGWGGTYFERA